MAAHARVSGAPQGTSCIMQLGSPALTPPTQNNNQTNTVILESPNRVTGSAMTQQQTIVEKTSNSQRNTLVDLLIDSQLDWRQLISEANGQGPIAHHLSETQIKRQEIIHELIQTERHHCLTLALMRQVYLAGLLKLNELRQRNPSTTSSGKTSSSIASLPVAVNQDQQQHVNGCAEPIDTERLFPALEELIQAHELLFAHLRLRLVDCCSRPQNVLINNNSTKSPPPIIGIIGPLGDLLIDQFRLSTGSSSQLTPSKPSLKSQKLTTSGGSGATNGQKLLTAYAKFCGQHYESSRYFKQLIAHDKEFKHFIEECNKVHPACKQRGIAECNLLVAQRLTKYPLLIEQLIKTSKDEPNDEEVKLRRALAECRALLAELNAQLARKESFERLLDIYAQFSPKSYTIFYHKSTTRPFTKHDLLQHKRLRELVHSDDQIRLWSASRRKLFSVLCLILNDIIVFLRVDRSPLSSTAGNSVAPSHGQTQEQHSHSHSEYQHDNPSAAALMNSNLATGSQYGLSNLTTTRYYFANLDNKSSVISLSKLLVRDKAVEEPEPRLYLISSSPKQPEMYELAFVSRRHQANFVEKLRQSIERHNSTRMFSSQLATSGSGSGSNGCAHRSSSFECLSSSSSTCCGGDDDSSEGSSNCSLAGNDDDDDELNDDDDQELDNELDDDDDDDELDDELDDSLSETGAGAEANSMSGCFSSERLNLISEANNNKSQVAAAATTNHEDLDELKLDIEQELVAEPEDSAQLDCQISSAQCNKQDELIGGGLSERARDSCDEREIIATNTTTNSRLKAKANRRRRFHLRPRQVSNQSSSSDSGNSSAAHTSTLNELDPNVDVAIQQCGGTQDAEGVESQQVQQVQVSATSCGGGEPLDEDLDSGRGRDECSSGSSSANHSIIDSADKKSLGHGEQPPEVGDRKLATTKSVSRKVLPPVPTGQQQVKSSSSTTASCGGAQHRKLSTVSSISNQMKLIQKLRSVGLLEMATISGRNITSHEYTPTNSSDPLSPAHSSSSTSSTTTTTTMPTTKPTTNLMVAGRRQRCQQLRRRSLFIPEQKLEELRNHRIKLDKDKQEWQVKFDRMQEQLLNERRELDLAREQLKRDRQQVENEREQLFRKLDILKENGILLSPSHKIIITSPDLQHLIQHQQQSIYHHQQQQQQQQSIYTITNRPPPTPPTHGQQYYSLDNPRTQLQQPQVVFAPQLQQQQQQQQLQHKVNQHHHHLLHCQQQQPAKVPLYLSQSSGGSSALPTGRATQDQAQQQQQRQQYTSRVPFIGALPGASFLVKRFGSSATTAQNHSPPTQHQQPTAFQQNSRSMGGIINIQAQI